MTLKYKAWTGTIPVANWDVDLRFLLLNVLLDRYCRKLDMGIVHVLLSPHAALLPNTCEYADVSDDCCG